MPEAVTHVGSGKVRELYELDDERLLLVASDRISTFDVVLPTEIPDKGRVLTGLSAFWFARTRELVPNHLLALRPDGRSTECRRLEMLPLECVVRGYLTGSGWKDYRATGSVCGHVLPEGLRDSDRLPEPIFTPSTKAHEGHDENIDRERAAELVGQERFDEVERISIELYRFASEYAAERGILIADTKFEFGLDPEGRLVLGDEAFTPDSSRFWPADEYEAGRAQPSFDKQFVRDYCERLGWDKTAPGPRAAGGRRRRHPRPLRRGVRAADRDRVRRLPRRPRGRALVKATILVRPKPGILDPQGEAVQSSLRQLGFAVDEARVGRVIDLELDGARRGRCPGRARAGVRAAAREPADRVLRDRAGAMSGEAAPARSRSSSSPARTTTGTRRSRSKRLGAERDARLARRARAPRGRARSCSRAASRTATTSAAARSPASRP